MKGSLDSECCLLRSWVLLKYKLTRAAAFCKRPTTSNWEQVLTALDQE